MKLNNEINIGYTRTTAPGERNDRAEMASQMKTTVVILYCKSSVKQQMIFTNQVSVRYPMTFSLC